MFIVKAGNSKNDIYLVFKSENLETAESMAMKLGLKTIGNDPFPYVEICKNDNTICRILRPKDIKRNVRYLEF